MEAAKQKLKKILWEMFQFDHADLDFGMYRILNVRRGELQNFFDRELLPQVEKDLATRADERASVEQELRAVEADLKRLGVPDFTVIPRWKELKAKLDALPDVRALAREVFSDLTTFFGRYYDDGDFLALPRYKGDVYSIPYDGQEVRLHWANADQYYVKTSETFSNWDAVLPGHIEGARPRLRFRLVGAASDTDNAKAVDAKKRRFVLREDRPVEVEGAVCTCFFEYRAAEGNQKVHNEVTEKAVLAAVPPAWRSVLMGAPPDSDRTWLGLHLFRYTRRNTTDYFIHKDLRGFLRRELDFFLKNEVLFLDDIEGRTAVQVEDALRKIKAIRSVGHRIIDFLAQIEEFQKRLFLKRKFVLRTDWCVTLDRVPRDLWAEVVANERQVQRWRDLFAIQDIQADLVRKGGDKVDEAFLEQNKGLVVESKFFDGAFVRRLVSGLPIGLEPEGILVRGENFQALSVLQSRYSETVNCTFIDPPYNTGGDGFIYKDAYQHSSWLSMMADRLALARGLHRGDSAIVISIDGGERDRLGLLAREIIGQSRYWADFVWQKKDTPANDSTGVSVTHDYLLLIPISDEFKRGLIPRTSEQLSIYKNPDGDPRGVWTRTSITTKNFVKGNDYTVVSPTGREVRPPPGMGWAWTRERMDEAIRDNLIWWGIESDGMPYRKRFLSELEGGVVPTSWWDYEVAGTNRNAKAEIRDLFEGEPPFDTPKPTQLVRRVLQVVPGEVVLDFFAGSGTTGHAVLNLNREDGGNRRFILVEMGDHFETVLLPRILKATHSKDWKDGKPVDRKGVSALYKVITLESYDDTLDNIELRRDPTLEPLFAHRPSLREDYLLRYLLDFESRGSLLDLPRFRKPWDYRIRVRRGGVIEAVPVDLVETFNYLIGLRVRHQDDYGLEGVWFVEGTIGEEKVLVVWRDCDLVDDHRLNEVFRKAFGPLRSQEYQVVYVNGDNQLPIVRTGDDRWKVNPIEETFHARMFDTSTVA